MVDTGVHQVLIDTGYGYGATPDSGRLVLTLKGMGISPQELDTVILTHGHGDHIGGTIDKEDNITLPRARFVISAEEWMFWTTDSGLAQVGERMAGFARRSLPPIADRIEFIGAEQEVVPGIRAIAAPGHTVGHIALEISSNDQYLIFLADAALHPIQVEHPDWCAKVDQNPEGTTKTRLKLFKRAVANRALVLAFHFSPFPSLGYIKENREKWKWESAVKDDGERRFILAGSLDR